MQRTYWIGIVLALFAYFSTIYNIFTYFDSSIVVVSLIVVLALPASLYIKQALDRQKVAGSNSYHLGFAFIIATFCAAIFYTPSQPYVIAIHLITWSAISIKYIRSKSTIQ